MTFTFLIAHAVGCQIGGRLHGDQAEELEQVVLHHVAQGAGGVVIAPRPPSMPRFSAQVIWMWLMYLLFQSGSKIALAKRSTIRFCAVSLPR
jgi:hypothetical protein